MLCGEICQSLANGVKMIKPSDGLTSRRVIGVYMDTQADEVIDQGNDWQEVEAEQEQSSEAEKAIEQDEPEAESDTQEGEEPEGDEQEAEEEVELFLGDEKLESPTSEPEVKDTDLVKKLRKEIQERNRELAAERAKQKAAPAVSVDEQLVMPTLEDADYDDAAYQQKVIEYLERKSAQDKAKAEREAAQAKLMEVHNQKLAAYKEGVAKLKVKGFAEAEKAVLDEVPENVQGAILHYADKPEIVVLAAGLNPAIRKQLAETTDPVALGKLIGSIEAKAKLLPKSKTGKPSPTSQVRGAGGAVIVGLEKALDAARKSGNYDEVMRLKRKLKK